MSEEFASNEQSKTPKIDYSLIQDKDTGLYTASIKLDDVRYDVTPTTLDPKIILTDRRRYSRTSFIEELMGTPYEHMAILNRAILLVAFDAFEAGTLPPKAWQAYRAAVTLRHDALLQALRTDQATNNNRLTRIKHSPPRTRRAVPKST